MNWIRKVWIGGCLLTSTICSGQVNLQVLDEADQPIPGAHISFKTGPKEKTQVILSDNNGTGVIPVKAPFKAIYIEIKYLGYADIKDTLSGMGSVSYSLEPDEVTLNQVVVTGQYASNSPEKSIHKIKIIDRKQMESRGVVNLSDALQFETNLRLGQDNQLGASANVQGISGENVKIMIDGVPVVGRQDGNIDLNQINLNNIERIEIIEGPLSVKYGTNALAGTINLISKKDQKNNYETGINTYYESVGQYNIDARLSWKLKNHQLALSGGRNYFDGWTPGEPITFLPKARHADSLRSLQWDQKEQLFANFQYQFSQKQLKVRLFGDYFGELIVGRGLPRAPYYTTAYDEHFYTKRYNFGINVDNVLYKNMNWSVLAAYNAYSRYKNTLYTDLTNLQETLSGNPSDHDTSSFNNWMSRGSIIKVERNSKLNWELGYDLNHETAEGKRIENQLQQLGDYAIFGSMEWNPYSVLTIKPGLRYAYNTAYEAPIIPSLNLKYVLGNTTFRGSYAMGFRSPSLKELYFEFVDVNHNIYGNADLKAETSNNYQIDATQKLIKNQSIVNLGVGLFYNDIREMIALAALNAGTEYRYTNIGRYKTQGLDLNLGFSHNHWKVSVGFVYSGRSNHINDSVNLNDMVYSPELRATALYEFKKLAGNISLNYKYNGSVPGLNTDENGTITQSNLEAYDMLDIAATKYFWKNRLHLIVGAKNLFDVQNIGTSTSTGGTHNSTAGSMPVSWGRTFFTSIKFNVGWK